MGLTQVVKACMLREDKLIAEAATEVYRALKAHDLNIRISGVTIVPTNVACPVLFIFCIGLSAQTRLHLFIKVYFYLYT